MKAVENVLTSFQSLRASTAHHNLMAATPFFLLEFKDGSKTKVTQTHIYLCIEASPKDVTQKIQSKHCLGYFQ